MAGSVDRSALICMQPLIKTGKVELETIICVKTRLGSLVDDRPSPSNSAAMHSRLVLQDRHLCLGGTAYIPGAANRS